MVKPRPQTVQRQRLKIGVELVDEELWSPGDGREVSETRHADEVRVVAVARDREPSGVHSQPVGPDRRTCGEDKLYRIMAMGFNMIL